MKKLTIGNNFSPCVFNTAGIIEQTFGTEATDNDEHCQYKAGAYDRQGNYHHQPGSK